jgi:hypothetical protein
MRNNSLNTSKLRAVVVLFEAVEVAIKVVQIITLRTIHINQMAATIYKLKGRRKTKVLYKDKARQLATTVLMVSRILHHT